MKAFSRRAAVVAACAASGAAGLADITAEWTTRIPADRSLSAGMSGFAVTTAGEAFVCGANGSSGNNNVLTAKIGADGGQIWSMTYDGPSRWHEGAGGLALSPDGALYVTGSTPGPGLIANVLLLRYQQLDGTRDWAVQWDGGAVSDSGRDVAVDADGFIYVGGGTVGDGLDCLTLKFDSGGAYLWDQLWDGPPSAPFSSESVRQIALTPDGNVVILTAGMQSSLHPDFVVVKYDAATGTQLWSENFGVNGEDSPAQMVVDAAGDIYVTGVGINFSNQYLTVKFDGDDGAVLWSAYDTSAFDDNAVALALDGLGGVYITGAVDPDGDVSNFNDNIYTVKRDATSGSLLWTHEYGANCIGCLDTPGAIGVDSAGNVFVAGSTSSPPYSSDQILLVLDAATGLESERGIVSSGVNEGVGAGFLRFDAQENVYLGGNYQNFNTSAVDLTVVRYASLVPTTPADLDGDGDVDLSDLGVLLADYGCTPNPEPCAGDLDGDGDTDLSDLGVLLSNFGM